MRPLKQRDQDGPGWLPLLVDAAGLDCFRNMTAITERILHEALSLPQEERAMLADRLMDSLEHPPAEELRVGELEATLRQRMEELDSGTVVPIPWSHVRREVLGLES